MSAKYSFNKIEKFLCFISQALKLITSRESFFVTVQIITAIDVIISAIGAHFDDNASVANILMHWKVVVVFLYFTESIMIVLADGIRNALRKNSFVYNTLVTFLAFLDITLHITAGWRLICVSIIRGINLINFFKFSKFWTQISSIVHSFIYSIKGVLSLTVFLMTILIIYSLLGNQMFGRNYNIDKKDPQCLGSFETFPEALLLTFVLLTGDGWTKVMMCTRNLSTSATHHIITVLVFLSFVIFGNFIMMNIFLSIIIDTLTNEFEKSQLDLLEEVTKTSNGSKKWRILKCCFANNRQKTIDFRNSENLPPMNESLFIDLTELDDQTLHICTPSIGLHQSKINGAVSSLVKYKYASQMSVLDVMESNNISHNNPLPSCLLKGKSRTPQTKKRCSNLLDVTVGANDIKSNKKLHHSTKAFISNGSKCSNNFYVTHSQLSPVDYDIRTVNGSLYLNADTTDNFSYPDKVDRRLHNGTQPLAFFSASSNGHVTNLTRSNFVSQTSSIDATEAIKAPPNISLTAVMESNKITPKSPLPPDLEKARNRSIMLKNRCSNLLEIVSSTDRFESHQQVHRKYSDVSNAHSCNTNYCTPQSHLSLADPIGSNMKITKGSVDQIQNHNSLVIQSLTPSLHCSLNDIESRSVSANSSNTTNQLNIEGKSNTLQDMKLNLFELVPLNTVTDLNQNIEKKNSMLVNGDIALQTLMNPVIKIEGESQKEVSISTPSGCFQRHPTQKYERSYEEIENEMPNHKSFFLLDTDSKFRKVIWRLVNSPRFNHVNTFFIIASSFQLAMEDPYPKDPNKETIMFCLEYLFTGNIHFSTLVVGNVSLTNKVDAKKSEKSMQWTAADTLKSLSAHIFFMKV